MNSKPVRHLIVGMGLLLLFLSGCLCVPRIAHAATAAEINASVDAALKRFTEEVDGANDFLNMAKGVLVIPGVIKAGFFVGGQYGEGALRIGGKTVAYYSLAGGSFGLQFGAQKMDVILLFLQNKALDRFRSSSGWRAGVDGSIALINQGAGGSIDTTKFKQPIVGFIVGQQGLMVDVSLEGSKFTRIKR